MVFSKKFDYRKRTKERDLFFGLPSTPFLVFLSFIAILLIFNLIIINNSITGNVVSDLNLRHDYYDSSNARVDGEFSLAFSRGDLIPKNSIIQILMSSPACPLYYECSDGSLSEWHTYDKVTGNCRNIVAPDSPWDTCPDFSEYTGNCTTRGHRCCNVGFGQGLYYGNLNCGGTQQCFDRCTDYRNVSLESFILAHDSTIPYSGNLTSGTYNNVNGDEPIGSGEGFGYCGGTIIVPKPPVSLYAIAPITGNSITGNVPAGYVTINGDLYVSAVDYNYDTKILRIIIAKTDTLDKSVEFTVQIYNNNTGAFITSQDVTMGRVTAESELSSTSGNEIINQETMNFASSKAIEFNLATYVLAGNIIKIVLDNPPMVGETNENNNIEYYFILPQTDLNITNANYNFNTNTLDVNVKNWGQSVPSTTAISVSLYERVDSTVKFCPAQMTAAVIGNICLLETQYLDGLNYDETKTVSFNQNLINKNITVSVSSIADTNPTNNQLNLTIGTAPIPADLILTELIYDYQAKQLKGKIKNVGGLTAQAGSIVSVCYVGLISAPIIAKAVSSQTTCYNINSITLDSIPAGGTVAGLEGRGIIFYTDLNRDYEGKTIKIIVDSTNVIAEGTVGEANNINETYITPITQLPDIQVLNYVYDCKIKTMAITLKNNGANPTGPFVLSFCTRYEEVMSITTKAITGMMITPSQDALCVQTLIPNIDVSSLIGGEVRTINVQNTLFDGTTFTLDANPSKTIFESDYTNNRLSVSIPRLPDFEVSNPVYYPGSNYLLVNVMNKGTGAGIANITVCQMRRKCIDEPAIVATKAIQSFTQDLTTLALPCRRFVMVCEDINSTLVSLNPGLSTTVYIGDALGYTYNISADRENIVCELDETNNFLVWPTGSCIGGGDENIQDPCSGTYNPTQLNDTCFDSTYLNEYYCESSICINRTANCAYGCNISAGVCNQAPAGSCTETDGGNFSLIAGTCSGVNGNFTDTCSNTALTEYSCLENNCVVSTYLISNLVSGNCFSCQTTANGGQCSNNTYSCAGWNNVYSANLSDTTINSPFDIITPDLDLGYFILNFSLVADGVIMASDNTTFFLNDTTYRICVGSTCAKKIGMNMDSDCSSTSDCGGSSGGGGGGDDTTRCYEDWNCGTWSSCGAEGIRTRSCTRCTMSNTESEVCVYGCTEDWECADWSYCDDSGIQTQICNDRNRCSSRNSEYVQQRNCCTENWDCKWGTCQDGKQAKVCTDNNNCGTGFLKPLDETRECSGGFGIDLSNVPLWVKIAVPIAIIGGVLVSLFLVKRKPVGIIKGKPKLDVEKISQTPSAKANYPELTNYIKTARGQGINENDIKKKLLDAGWPKDVVDSGLKK
ncbi:hypothetical protein J4465_00085 [Candidatus Pacearchaeota archaeon]|nr:hypothetical protein [Candidatus Pacearchaeota archaeon]